MINKNIINVLALGFLVLQGCGNNNQPNNMEIVKPDTIVTTKSNSGYIAKVSNKSGGSFTINISARSFSAKANTDGTAAKTEANIHHYLVYLLKNSTTTAYPSGGNPLGDAIGTPFFINKTVATQTVTFTGLPASFPDAYYVAVKAQDSSNNELVKPNNGGAAWSSTSLNQPIGVTSGAGAVVQTNLTVTAGTLPISLNLLDGVGAKVETSVTINNGSAPTNASVGAEMF